MPITAAVRRIIELIEGAASTEQLQCIDPDSGEVPELYAVPDGPERAFDIAPGSIADAGEGGCIPARVRLSLRLRVRYRLAGSRIGRLVSQQSDWQAIRDALDYSPGTWQQSTTGICVVITGPFGIEPLSAPGQLEPSHEAISFTVELEVDP